MSTSTQKKNKKTIVFSCGLLGIDRQIYYRVKPSRLVKQAIAQEVIAMVNKVRMRMPRIGILFIKNRTKKIKSKER